MDGRILFLLRDLVEIIFQDRVDQHVIRSIILTETIFHHDDIDVGFDLLTRTDRDLWHLLSDDSHRRTATYSSRLETTALVLNDFGLFESICNPFIVQVEFKPYSFCTKNEPQNIVLFPFAHDRSSLCVGLDGSLKFSPLET